MRCNDIENSVSLATELLRELKRQSRRWFISFIICLILLFLSNMAWLYVWNQYDYESYSYEQDGNGVNNINSSIGGDINNGATAENKKKN